MAQIEQDRTEAAKPGGSKVFVLVVAAIVVAGMAAIAFVASGIGEDDTADTASDNSADSSEDDSQDVEALIEQTATVTFIGDAMAPLPEGVNISDPLTDPMAGQVAPTLTATDFDGTKVTIEPDGEPKAIYFLAHWCPHCQAEVPLIQELIADGALPDGLTIYGVSSIVDSGRGNFPPSDWFPAEGFTPTVVRDDADSSAFAHFGGTGLPYAIYLDSEHRVVARSAGSLNGDAIADLWQMAVQAE